jgi:hypothetical protein
MKRHPVFPFLKPLLLGLALTPAVLFPLGQPGQARQLHNYQCHHSFKQVRSANLPVFNQPPRDRAGRAVPDARPVSVVSQGTTVLQVLGDLTGNFAEIETPQRIRGWVAVSALTPAPGIANQFNGFYEVKDVSGGRVMLRAEPSRQSTILNRLPSGTVLRLRSGENTGEWTHVTDSSGRGGYVASNYLVCTTARF